MSFNGDLTQYHVPGTDKTFYIPEFVSPEEEAYLIQKIQESPLPKWKQLVNRRLQVWGGGMTAKGALIPEQMPSYVTKYPDIVHRIRATGSFDSSPHGAPNHIIMNEYHPGQGIMPHEDGPAYHPAVATLSLGSHAVFHYYRYKLQDGLTDSQDISEKTSSKGKVIDPAPIVSMLLEPRSLVVTTSSLYREHLHGIDDVMEDIFPSPGAGVSRVANASTLTDSALRDVVQNGGILKRDTRYSLTCRDVAKVATAIPSLKR